MPDTGPATVQAEPISIVVVDDHQIFREGLRVLIDRQANMQVVAEADDGREAVRLARELSPDVVVMDVSMPQLSGFEATRQIAEYVPGTRILALSMHSDEPFVAEMLNSGASGYLLKDCAFEELTQAIDTVISGRVYLSADITARVVEDYVRHHSGSRGEALSRLSPREKEVIQLLAEGKSVKDIAVTLNLSVKTIETHRKRVMTKLEIDSIAGLTKWAIRAGLTSL